MALNRSLSVLATVAAIVAIWGSGCTKKSPVENIYFGALSSGITNWDPAMANNSESQGVLTNIYDTLFVYDPTKRPLTLMANLAEGEAQATDGGRVYTITIKSNIMFSDDPAFKKTSGKGRELEASDIVYTLKRLADPKLSSPGYWLVDGKIKGLNEWRSKVAAGSANYDTEVEGLRAASKHTLILTLTKPNYQLPHLLAHPYSSVVAREAVEHYGKDFSMHAIGTGPFVLSNSIQGNKIVLTKKTSNKEHNTARVDKIVLYEIPEDHDQWKKFLSGELDSSIIPRATFDEIVDKSTRNLKAEYESKGIRLVLEEEPEIIFNVFNMKDPFLGKHKLVRQAMSLATDRSAFIEKFYNGRALAAQGPIPPGIEGYEQGFKNPYSEFNLPRAKELLKKAGFPDGKGIPEIVYESGNSTNARQIADLFSQEMAAIGIKVTVRVNTPTELNEKLLAHKAQIFGLAWLADYADPQNFFQLFYGPNINNGLNGAHYKNTQFDRLYEGALTMPPGEKRTEQYRKMRDILVEDCPWSFNVHRIAYYAKHSWLDNFKPNSLVGFPYKQLSIDPKLRAEHSK